MSFFDELKRRNVFRAAAFYAASAWLLVQVATQVFPLFHVDEWVVRWIVVAAIIGFPFAMLFSWFYEWTPEGIRREGEVELRDSITQRTGKKLDRAIIAVLSVAVVLLLANTFVLHKADNEIAATPGKSIAVLPFENLSEDKANAYFATGMQDEILTKLAGIHDLKVISRTSTEQYASRPPNLRIVAEQLGVATVLEGSVQKSAGKVRINLQLIDARTDSHLWAQNYDRDLTDVFAVQSDVAEKVADALKAQLVPAEAERIASVPTHDPDAYDLYLRANSHANRAYDQTILVAKELPSAIALYEQALAKDPNFAVAWAALSLAHIHMYFFAPDRSEARLSSAKATAEQSLTLQPGLGEGHFAEALYYYWGHRDYEQAILHLQTARKSLPNSADIELYFAAIARRQGHWDDAIAGFKRAVLLDPRSSSSLEELGLTYSKLRRYAEADEAYSHAAAVTQNPAEELVTRAFYAVAWKGDLSPLRASLSALAPDSDVYAENASFFFQLDWWSRDYAAAAKVAKADEAADWTDQSNVALPRGLYLAWAYQAAGDSAKANQLYVELRAQAQAALQQRPDDADLHLTLGFTAAGLGMADEAEREGRQATSLMPVSRDAVTGPAYLGWLAQLDVRVGKNNQAIDLLQQLLAMPAGHVITPAFLQLDPIWDPLRKDPRFQALLGSAPAAVKAPAHE
jgi:serine/threonine-protein kinase